MTVDPNLDIYGPERVCPKLSYPYRDIVDQKEWETNGGLNAPKL